MSINLSIPPCQDQTSGASTPTVADAEARTGLSEGRPLALLDENMRHASSDFGVLGESQCYMSAIEISVKFPSHML